MPALPVHSYPTLAYISIGQLCSLGLKGSLDSFIENGSPKERSRWQRSYRRNMDWQVKMMSVNFCLFLPNVIFYSICFLKKMQWIVWFLKFVVLLPFISNFREHRAFQVCRGPEVTLDSKDFPAWKVLFLCTTFWCKYNEWDSYFTAHKCLLNSHSHRRQLGLLQIEPQYKWRRKSPPAPNPRDLNN